MDRLVGVDAFVLNLVHVSAKLTPLHFPAFRPLRGGCALCDKRNLLFASFRSMFGFPKGDICYFYTWLSFYFQLPKVVMLRVCTMRHPSYFFCVVVLVCARGPHMLCCVGIMTVTKFVFRALSFYKNTTRAHTHPSTGSTTAPVNTQHNQVSQYVVSGLVFILEKHQLCIYHDRTL